MKNDRKIRIEVTRDILVKKSRNNGNRKTVLLFAFGEAEALREIQSFREFGCGDTTPFKKANLYYEDEFLTAIHSGAETKPFKVIEA